MPSPLDALAAYKKYVEGLYGTLGRAGKFVVQNQPGSFSGLVRAQNSSGSYGGEADYFSAQNNSENLFNGSSPGSLPGADDSFDAILRKAGYLPVPGKAGVYFNPENGDLIDTTKTGSGGGGGDGSGVGYAQIAEQRRQFDIQEARAGREFEEQSGQFTRQEGRLNNQYTMDAMRGMEEFQKNYALQLEQLGLSKQQIAQAAEQFSRSFAENQRQFNTQEGRLGKQLDLEAELGRGGLQETTRSNKAREQDAERQRVLAEQQYIGQILSRPSDFLARAFSSRGETSPYATVTQADLINNLKAGVSGATKGFAKGGTTNEGKFVTGEQGSEVIINPTNAPIMVLNHEQSQGQMGKLPGYAGGTTDMNDPNYDWFGALNAAQAQAQAPPSPAPSTDVGMSNTGPQTFYNTNPDFKLGPTNSPGVQTGSLPGSGEYYRNPDGGSGATGDASSQFIFFQSILGLPSEQAAQMAGFGSAAEAIRSVDPGYLTFEEAQRNTLDGGYGYSGRGGGITQEELKRLALSSAPPGSRAALYGGKIGAARPAGQLTLGRLGRLTGPELQSLNTLLAAAENSDLETELGLLQQRFGPVVNRSRGRLQV